jgi:sugar phosphate isomerase/epimerase
MHPNGLGTKGCINQLSEARTLAAEHDSVGLTVDFYHSWWDADLEPTLAAEVRRLEVVQICGVVVPTDGGPAQRAELSTGPADLSLFLRALDTAGYSGAIEYEVFHDQMPGTDAEGLLDRLVADIPFVMN